MSDPRAQTLAWVEDFVVRLGLCPFAARPLRAGAVGVEVLPAATVEATFYAAGTRVQRFVAEGGAGAEDTVLLVLPELLEDFGDFLGFVGALEALLAETGAEAFVQLAHFHPDYVFAGVPPDDPANATNRSPYPTVQLLRTEHVARAVAAHPDAAGIPARNVALLRGE